MNEALVTGERMAKSDWHETPTVSIVIPCLNEETTLGSVLSEASDAFRQSPYTFEMIVADNGSTDRSREIALEHGAKVIPVPSRGYGAALLGGFNAATGHVILFGDADATYDFKQGPTLVSQLLKSKSAMIMGTRIRGDIESGAMPLLHRYLGTPALTHLINVLFKGKITDCNSGFRAFYRENLSRWQAGSPGMEFASELIVNCLKAGDEITELPITLRKDIRNRAPHLSTWRDGMRHLLFILSRAPQGFTWAGLALLLASLTVALPSMLLGATRWHSIEIFDFHSLILANLIGFLGTQAMSYGLLLDTQTAHPLPINQYLLAIREEVLLKITSALLALVLGFVVFIVIVWLRHGFNNLHFLRSSLSLLYITTVLGNLALGLFLAHIHKRV